MPIRFQLEVLGETEIDRAFTRISEKVENMEPLFTAILKELRLISRVQFLTEGAHGSGGWAPLADSTIQRKASAGLSPWIERASETLYNSLVNGGAGAIQEMGNDWMRYGTSVPYAKFQQTGTVNMPQRRLVQLTEDERREVVRMVQQYIVTGSI